MKFIILTILFPCVFGQAEVNCPPFSEDDGCNPPNLRCKIPAGADGCPVVPECMHIDPYERCSLKAVCPTQCLDGEKKCPGGVDADGCPLPDVCHRCHCPGEVQPVKCGPEEMFCQGKPDPNHPFRCNVPDTCVFQEKFAICQRFCDPAPCPQDEWQCDMPTDNNGCEMPRTCSTGGLCPELPGM